MISPDAGKACTMCKATKPLAMYPSNKRNGILARCKDCTRVVNRERSKRPESRAANAERLRRTYAKRRVEHYGRPEIKARRAEQMRGYTKQPDKRAHVTARWRVKEALRKGVLIRQPCQVCGLEKSDAHHPDYSKPLSVLWLCRPHHVAEHAKEARL